MLVTQHDDPTTTGMQGKTCSVLTTTCLQGEDQFQQLKQQLQRSLAQAVKRVAGRVAAFQQQLDDSQKAEALRKQADMLMANVHRRVVLTNTQSTLQGSDKNVGMLPGCSIHDAGAGPYAAHRVQGGATAVDVEDWESGKVVTLTLDPTKSGIEQAEALYKKARKQGHAAEKLVPLLEAAQEQVCEVSKESMHVYWFIGASLQLLWCRCCTWTASKLHWTS